MTRGLWSPLWNATSVRGAAVLDYGCGDGSFSHLMTSHGAQVYGVDISLQEIGRARAAAPAGGKGTRQFLMGDAHIAPFPDNFFDFVVGNGALHHLDLERAYAEIARVLKPGGRAFFMEPMYHHPDPAVWLLRQKG